jgi:hypothetical protein
MAMGEIAFVASTGEDYATNGYDTISLQTTDPREIVHHLKLMKSSPNFGNSGLMPKTLRSVRLGKQSLTSFSCHTSSK